MGWAPRMLIEAGLCWTILTQLPALVRAMTGGRDQGFGFMKLALGYLALSRIAEQGAGAATYAPRRLGRWGREKIQRHRSTQDEAEDHVLRDQEYQKLSEGAHDAAEVEQRSAMDTLDRDSQGRDQVSKTNRRLAQLDNEHERLESRLATAAPNTMDPHEEDAIRDRMEYLGEQMKDLNSQLQDEQNQLPAPSEIQHARSVIGRHGTGEIVLSRQDIERHMDSRVAAFDNGDEDARLDAQRVFTYRQVGRLQRRERRAIMGEANAEDRRREVKGDIKEERRSLKREDKAERRRQRSRERIFR